MLQQTQVDTVTPYYKHWIKTFPNLTKLAHAPLSRVLKCWEGLGYYRRARNLHRSAKIMVGKGGAKFPNTVTELQKLPGIGHYTAGAISSIAFNRPEPILDGNVKRVLARVLALREPVDKTSGEKKLWEAARRLVEGAEQPGDFNQALMELGALLCLPENPKCFICPLEKICKAHEMKKEDRFPVKARREKVEKLKTVAAVIWKKDKVLLEKQPLESRWGGLWTFPQWISNHRKPETEFLEERVRKDLGLRIRALKPKMELEHGFTKYRIRLKVFEGKVALVDSVITRKPLDGGAMARWVDYQKISRLPLPRPHQKIAQGIENHA